MLYLYNSLTRTKELFQPVQPGKVGIYVCGITVYDRCHLGHARSMVCFDVMVRYLRSQGYAVTYVRNITDIDDKIIARARERGISIDELTSQYINAMHEDTRALNILTPDIQPRATAHIESIIQLIGKLIDKGYAYLSDNGDVCYQVECFKEYGKLSHKDLDGLIAGARVEVVKEKRSPLDFVLWKKAKTDEPSWPSPWGDGRPGWHIECSAMAMHELGEHFDIHGGGLDLQFPHHENEIAQSEAATGKKFADYWLHVGMLQVNNEKMAKSTGNFFTIEDVLQRYHPEVIRYFLLSSHYRSSLNYSEENLQNAIKALTRLYQSLKDTNSSGIDIDEHWLEQFNQAMNDDFNTPMALSVLFQLSHELNKTGSPRLASTLKQLASTLGLLQVSPESFLQSGINEVEKETVENLIAERLQARRERNWARADEIRQILANQGIDLEDGPEGTTWRKRVEKRTD
ncbi:MULTISPECIES: cysteine--tRNA ligase [unclassified Legionella]|uniref:cysteine--tRNA ligase n=1 Tax=unclassified Legionella TaxID=2622702 RepID=UPI0010551BF3|nr:MULTISPECIES: cysteine--tRNA ligase [unclassified Legionella]MDI9818262.1 cysteine--tRNA ligase [Legionella sp. PL877]